MTIKCHSLLNFTTITTSPIKSQVSDCKTVRLIRRGNTDLPMYDTYNVSNLIPFQTENRPNFHSSIISTVIKFWIALPSSESLTD